VPIVRSQQTWAYCDVRPDGTITYYGVADAHRIQARPNIHAVDTRRWVEEAVAWLGLQGWEMVGVVQGEGEGRTFYFKRTIDESTAGLEAEHIGVAFAGVGLAEAGSLPEEPDIPAINPVRLIEEEFLPD